MSKVIADPEVRLLATISATLKGDYLDPQESIWGRKSIRFWGDDAMRRVLIWGLFVLVLSAPVIAVVGDPMPDVSKLPAYYGTTSQCADGAPFGVLLLSDNDAGYAAVFFKPDDSGKARVPIVVVKISGDTDTVYIDLDRDGKVDRQGEPGEPGIGEGVCDIIHDIK